MPVDNLSTIPSAYIDANNPLEESEVNALSSYLPLFMWKKLQAVLLPTRHMYDDQQIESLNLHVSEEQDGILQIILTWCRLNPNASIKLFLCTIEKSTLSRYDQTRIFKSVLNRAYDLGEID